MYVIEHSVHGTFSGIDWSSSGNSYGPRFRWSIHPSEGETFHSKEEAMKKLIEIRAFKHYAWKRPYWIDNTYVVNLDTQERTGI